MGFVLAAGCATAKHRDPLPEVPIEYAPVSTADINVPDPPRPVASTPGSESVYARAHALAARGNTVGARALLEPRVYGGDATSDEITMLRGICKAQHDKACITRIDQKKK
jgi:hypothetical protein